MEPRRVLDPRSMGLSADRLEQTHRLLTDWTSQGDPPLPGACLLVGREDMILAPRFFGKHGPEPDAPALRSDGLFLIASITKPMVYLAALQLVEKGLLNLGDRVTRYLPEFAANHKEETRVIHLFTHTSGLPDMLPNNLELRQQQAPLERFIKEVLDVAPLFPAGTNFNYQSCGTLAVAEIVQRLTGKRIRDILRQQVFDPLGMHDTSLGSDGLAVERIVRVRTDAPMATNWDWNSTYWRRFGAPWGGAFSSAVDLARLCIFLLHPERSPRPVLSPVTVRQMISDQFDRLPKLGDEARRRLSWGLGWQRNRSGEFCELLGPDVFGHFGSTGTMLWVDPRTQLFAILLTNAPRDQAPWRSLAVSNAVAAALVE